MFFFDAALRLGCAGSSDFSAASHSTLAYRSVALEIYHVGRFDDNTLARIIISVTADLFTVLVEKRKTKQTAVRSKMSRALSSGL